MKPLHAGALWELLQKHFTPDELKKFAKLSDVTYDELEAGFESYLYSLLDAIE